MPDDVAAGALQRPHASPCSAARPRPQADPGTRRAHPHGVRRPHPGSRQAVAVADRQHRRRADRREDRQRAADHGQGQPVPAVRRGRGRQPHRDLRSGRPRPRRGRPIQAWVQRIREALREDQFVLNFQPMISLDRRSERELRSAAAHEGADRRDRLARPVHAHRRGTRPAGGTRPLGDRPHDQPAGRATARRARTPRCSSRSRPRRWWRATCTTSSARS